MENEIELNVIAFEAFGSVVAEGLRKDEHTLEDVMVEALEELQGLVGLENVDTIVTGMNEQVTYALEDAVESMGLDAEVDAFYPNVENIMEEDEKSYQEAWQDGFNWRNNKIFTEQSEDDGDGDPFVTADLAVRVGDAGNNGAAFIEQARRKGVRALDLNLDRMVNQEKAYGDEPADSGSSSEEAEA